MAHFAILAPPLTGHVKPLAALASELARRGHRATFVHHRDAGPVAAAQGLDFRGFDGPPLVPHSGIFGTVREMARQTDMLCRHAPSLLREIGADAVLADQLEPAGGLVAEHLGLPFATIASALPVNRMGDIPPPYVGWAYRSGDKAREFYRSGWQVSDWLMRPVRAAIAANAARFGLSPRRTLDDCFSPVLQLAQAVPSIDFPRSALPPGFHYLGPFRHAATGEVDLGPADGRPLVYCSFGTLQGHRWRLFRKVALACADLDLRLVITHGGKLSEREIARLPGNPRVFDYVPQEAALEKADLVVTHGGFNTVLDALAAGKPIVALPIAFEQPAIAARIGWAGVGEAARARLLSRRRLRAAIERVLSVPDYRRRAEAVRAEIRSAGGVRRAADLVEAMLAPAAAPAPRAGATTAHAAPDDARDDSRSGNR